MAAGALIDRRRRVAAGIAAGQHSRVDRRPSRTPRRGPARVRELVTDADRARRPRSSCRCCESDVARAIGDGAVAIEARAARRPQLATEIGEPFLIARVAESWMMSLSGCRVRHRTTRRPRPGGADGAGHRRAARRGAALRRADPQHAHVGAGGRAPTRRAASQLADEALAIASQHGAPELMASAHLARRLALGSSTASTSAARPAFAAVARGRAARPTSQLQLTASLFALIDLLELGRIDEHLAMLETFRSPGPPRPAPHVVRGVRDVHGRAARLLSTGRYDEAQQLADEAWAAGVRSHGVNAEIAYAGIWYRLALDLGRLAGTVPEIERMVAASPRLRTWQDRAGCAA